MPYVIIIRTKIKKANTMNIRINSTIFHAILDVGLVLISSIKPSLSIKNGIIKTRELKPKEI